MVGKAFDLVKATWKALTFIGGVEDDILTVVYTWREDRRRLISARKANKRERDAYRAEITEQADRS